MIGGVANPLPPICLSCGVELPDANHPGDEDGVCPECFAESQAKAEAQLAKEQAEQFQFWSLEWFTMLSPEAQERKAASYEDNDYGTPSLREQYEASFRRAS